MSIQMSYRRAELPAPHLAPRMQYWFPQMASQGPGMRPTPKGCGPGQSCCADCAGATSIPVQAVGTLGRTLGAGGLAGLATANLGRPSVGAFTDYQRTVLSAFLIVGIPGAIFAGYHGYKRSRGNVGSVIGWGFFGLLAPIITGAVALAQGYGEPALRGSARAARR